MSENDAIPESGNRRLFLKGALTAGAAVAGGAALAGPNLLAANRTRFGKGDVAILRFLAAAELIEADLWQQYAELGGLTPGQLPEENAPFTPIGTRATTAPRIPRRRYFCSGASSAYQWPVSGRPENRRRLHATGSGASACQYRSLSFRFH
jgi:hypothetical protein